MNLRKLFLCAALTLAATCAFAAPSRTPKVFVTDLTTELRHDPEGIDCETPRLSWKIVSRENKTLQTAYRIQVIRKRDGAKVWDSGKVGSYQSVLVPYGGPALESETDYSWTVRVWTTDGASPKNGEHGHWSTGLRDTAAWMGARWIGINEREKLKADPTRLAARYLRKEFSLDDKVVSAKLYMSALGVGDAAINGQRVCEQMFMHPPVLFDKTVYYRTYDVTNLLQKGDNALTVLLGCGRYQSLSAKTLRCVSDPRVRLVLKVSYKGGGEEVIVSDTSWIGTSGGPITCNNEYDGEYYDARLEMPGWQDVSFTPDARWKGVDIMGTPKGRLRAMTMDDMAIQDRIPAEHVRKVGLNRYIVDFGQNMTGYVVMTLEGKAGQPVVFKYAEKLTDKADSLNMASLRRTLATDQYIPAADGKFTFKPTFPMHGFRYMEIEGVSSVPICRNMVGQVIWDKMEVDGQFECSDPRLNRLYKNVYCGLRSNYRGMPIDCPQRDERQGWIGDRGGTIWGEPYLFGVAPLYRKWMDDVYDSMKNNRISVVSPRYWSIYTDDMSHSSVFLYMAEMLYSRYGDDSGIRTYYPAMKAWFEQATAKNLKEDGIFRMKHDEYKDWIVPPESPELIHATDPSRITKSPVLQTGILVGTLDLLMRFARLTGNAADIPAYEGLKARVIEAYNREFFDAEHNCYDNNTLTANLIPVYFGIVPADRKQAVVENIVNRIENDFGGHLCVGNVGMRYVMEVLTRNGHADLAYKLCTIDTYPSWGYMIKKGATTVWELWNGDEAGPSMNSGCHAHLIGDLLRWYYEDLAGIAPERDPASPLAAAVPGFRRIWMEPCFPEGLDHVKASFESPQGTISSEWTRIGHKLVWRVEIPVGSTATLVAPAGYNFDTKEKSSYTEDGKTRIFLSSGKYILQSK